jgi:hypothetical protein
LRAMMMVLSPRLHHPQRYWTYLVRDQPNRWNLRSRQLTAAMI